jgi:hypothetical protein
LWKNGVLLKIEVFDWELLQDILSKIEALHKRDFINDPMPSILFSILLFSILLNMNPQRNVIVSQG